MSEDAAAKEHYFLFINANGYPSNTKESYTYWVKDNEYIISEINLRRSLMGEGFNIITRKSFGLVDVRNVRYPRGSHVFIYSLSVNSHIYPPKIVCSRVI